jgi:predicted RNA-binding protein with PIN domain
MGPAIAAARVVLRDLDDAELTPPLRRVAASQGGRLPPPLALRLLKELDENEWFRRKVADAWDGDGVEPSGLFLTRPAGWWVEVALAVADAAEAAEQQRLADAHAKLEVVAAKRDAAREKAKDLKRALEEARRGTRNEVEEARRKAEARYESDRASIAAHRSKLEETRQQLADVTNEHAALQEAFAALRSRFAKARRGRPEGADQAGGSRSVPVDPVKLARLLDLQTASFGRDPEKSPAASERKVQPLVLGAGIRPDSSDAIRWLIGLDEPVVVVVDGYNAQFHVDRGGFTSGAARRHLVDALKRLRARAQSKHRIVVVYDSTLPGERIPRTSAGGVEVRFAEEDRIADEEIVEMSAALGRSVVISSDRAVREGAEENGAVVLWSEALQLWLQRD